jgi:hypothetical protein
MSVVIIPIRKSQQFVSLTLKNLPMGRERGGCAVCGPPLRWAGDGDWSGCCCGCWMGGGAWVTRDLVLSDSGDMVKS